MARRSEHSREELQRMALEAAAAIVEREGAAALTARKLATAIGYTVGTLYLVFRNLDDLILQVNAATLDALYREMAAASGRCRKPQRCVEALAGAYIDYAAAHPHRWRLVFDHHLPAEVSMPNEYGERIARIFGLLEEALSALLDGASPAAVHQAASVLWAGVHGICVLSLDDKLAVAGGGTSAHALATSLVNNYLAGLAR